METPTTLSPPCWLQPIRSVPEASGSSFCDTEKKATPPVASSFETLLASLSFEVTLSTASEDEQRMEPWVVYL